MKRYTRAALDGYGMLKLPKRIRKPSTSAPMGIGASAMLADEYLPTIYTNIPPDNSRGWRANNLALVGLGRNTRSRPRRPSLPQPVVPQRTTSYRPLKFANPFYTTGAKKYAFPTFNSVMSSNGLTSIEQFQKQLRAARYKELLNSGFNMGDQFASIELHDDKNDELTFPMPHGVRNVESRDKNIDAMKKIEMQNAGIYDNKMRERVEMFKAFEDKRKKREREEYIQWLSEHYNEAYIPPDLAEEVKAKMESKQMGETDKKKTQQPSRQQKELQNRKQHKDKVRL